MILTEKDKRVLWAIGNAQLFIQATCVTEYVGEISFEFEECRIVNPMIDETGRFEVDPITYYGRDFLESEFIGLINKC